LANDAWHFELQTINGLAPKRWPMEGLTLFCHKL